MLLHAKGEVIFKYGFLSFFLFFFCLKVSGYGILFLPLLSLFPYNFFFCFFSMYAFMFVCIYVRTYVCTYVCMCVRMYVRLYVYVCMYECLYVGTAVYILP